MTGICSCKIHFSIESNELYLVLRTQNSKFRCRALWIKDLTDKPQLNVKSKVQTRAECHISEESTNLSLFLKACQA